ncbi:DUF6291 domain-containing protein [uncultured Alistipes sp.]|uniref:DUF6291 domain-containing protein n=1 Tax=uncultured Alistipes sp. TaxID=538949 RepID=UPI002621CFD9|nr:DUF6291 domain-containing protein [uncultured Alistipes sp.]
MSSRDTQKTRDGFTFFRSFRDAVEMTDETDQLVLYKAIANYALDGSEPDISAMGALGRLCWTAISPNIKSGRKNFENGCNGGAPKGNRNAKKQPKNNPDSTEKQPGETSNRNENRNGNRNENGILEKKVAPKRAAFVAPSLEEVADFFSTIKGTRADAERFFYHFEANGWKTTKGSMKSWTAAARKWMLNEPRFANTKAPETSRETQPRYKAL